MMRLEDDISRINYVFEVVLAQLSYCEEVLRDEKSVNANSEHLCDPLIKRICASIEMMDGVKSISNSLDLYSVEVCRDYVKDFLDQIESQVDYLKDEKE